MEQNQNVQPWQYPPQYPVMPPQQPQPPKEHPFFPTGKKELIFGIGAAVSGLAMVNCLIFGGANLGFALAVMLSICFSTAYLWCCDRKPDAYPFALMAIGVVIAAGFARSNDGFVEFVMVVFLFVAVNLALCLQAGQNRRNTAGLSALLDGPRAFFSLGMGKLPEGFCGLQRAMKNGGTGSKKAGAVLLGLAVMVPMLLIVLPLLISADAAFEGLVAMLPDFDVAELFVTLFFGGMLSCILYNRGVALRHAPKQPAAESKIRQIHVLTVNTALVGLCLVYGVYLFSQLAYFVGGFAGVLPEGFTMAEYARRGFFEMAALCAINLALIALAVGLVEKGEKTPLSTRLLCLFIGIVTVFFVITASAKMGMYIGSYGLTRLRVLTEVIMVFLGLATAVVCAWLFVPKMPYMKVIVIIALVMGAAVLWADVDTVVAAYNVGAYQAGTLKSVYVEYLTTLSSGAVPYIAELAEAGHPDAVFYMESVEISLPATYDLRNWNWASWMAQKLLQTWHPGR